jgi:hypothetical protein
VCGAAGAQVNFVHRVAQGCFDLPFLLRSEHPAACLLLRMSKADRYSSKTDIDDLDTLTEKLAADLRKSIRNLVRHINTPPRGNRHSQILLLLSVQ